MLLVLLALDRAEPHSQSEGSSLRKREREREKKTQTKNVNAHKEREGALKSKRTERGAGEGAAPSLAMNTKYSAAPPSKERIQNKTRKPLRFQYKHNNG